MNKEPIIKNSRNDNRNSINCKLINSKLNSYNNSLSNEIILSKSNNNSLISKGHIINNFDNYLETDENNMDYYDAIKKDKRTFCEFFTEKIKSNQIILNSFYAVDRLTPRTIKIMLFIIEIDLYLFVNENM